MKRLFTWLTVTVQCAWCKTYLHRAPFQKMVSHGICGRCLADKKFELELMRKGKVAVAMTCMAASVAFAGPMRNGINLERIADAIKMAEGCNPHYWYGVHRHGKMPLTEAEARSQCINILRREYARDGEPRSSDVFIHMLAPVYCGGDWRRWELNVKSIMKHQEKERK